MRLSLDQINDSFLHLSQAQIGPSGWYATGRFLHKATIHMSAYTEYLGCHDGMTCWSATVQTCCQLPSQ
jgi:hypothetical protein